MSTPSDEVVLTPEVASNLVAGRFQLHVPQGGVHRTLRAMLVERPAVPAALPPDYQLITAFRLSVIDSQPPARTTHGTPVPFELRKPAAVSFSYAGVEHPQLPETTLQLRMLISPEDLWVEIPATVDLQKKTVAAGVWSEGTYVLVANAGLLPLSAVQATIGKAGGSMDFARLHLEFPADCFPTDTEVTVGPPPTGFEPWGGALPFPFQIVAKRRTDRQPVHMLGAPLRFRVTYDDAELGNMPPHRLRIRHYNETTGWWESLPTTVDKVARGIMAETSHLSVFNVGGNSTFEEPFDFGSNWSKTDEFTAAATFAMPFELPPGPGGLAPDLKLVYNSQGSHWSQQGDRLDGRLGGKGLQSASWVGEGFDIPIGCVNRVFYNGAEHFSVSIFGQSFRLVHDGSRWRTEDEQFWKIDRDGTDSTTGVSYKWRVIKPDGTKYYFGVGDAGDTDIFVYYDFTATSQTPSRWMLSRIQDTHGNLIRILYARLSKQLNCSGASGTMTTAVYPTEIRYGGNDPNNLPYSIFFNRSSGTSTDYVHSTSIDRADVNVQDWINDGCTQLSFDVKYLSSIDVKVSGNIARRYKFQVSTTSIPMMLQKVEVWSDAGGTLKQTLLTVGYTEYTDTEYNSCAPGECQNYYDVPYQLVTSLTNGFGGSYQYAYASGGYIPNYNAYFGWQHKLYQGRVFDVSSMTVNPGFGGTSMVTTYLHEFPTGNGNWNWPEFKGHGRATSTQAGFQTVITFHQDSRAGRPMQTDHKDTSGAVVQSVVNIWTDEVIANASHFVRLDQTDVYLPNSSQPVAHKKTTYAYNTGQQGSAQYGNQTDVFEYDLNQSANWIRHTKKWFFPVDQTHRYIVSKAGAENLYRRDGSGEEVWERSTWYCYDGSYAWDNQIGSGQRGDDGSYRARLTAIRRNKDGANMADTTFGYDSYGNRTTTTEWNSYGTYTAIASVDGRTTTVAYDLTYHAYKLSETSPSPFNYVTSYQWDYVRSRLTRITDPNNAVAVHTYDALGRRIATWSPGDDSGQPGAATTTYRYLIGGNFPTRVQIGRRKDNGGGSFGRRAYQWHIYDGLGRLIQSQADFDRSSQVIRAQDVNEIRSALISRGKTPNFSAVTSGVDKIQAKHFVELRNSAQSLWTDVSLGSLPNWSSAVTPGGSSLGTTATPIYGSDLVDLRGWLNFYENNQSLTLTNYTYNAGTVIVVNKFYDNRGLLQKESVPHTLQLKVPGQFASGDWSPTANPGTSFTYDALRRPLTRTRPDGTTTFRWSYDGWSTTAKDENSHQKVFITDALGRLVKVQEFTGTSPYTLVSTTSYIYNVADQLTNVYDASCHNSSGTLILPPPGNNVTISYDKLGRKTAIDDPDTGYWSYDYDPIGTLKTQTDAKAQVLTFEYDQLSRLRFRKAGSTTLAEFVYDENLGTGYYGLGRRTTMKFGTSLANTVKLYFDQRGRVVKSEHALDSPPVTYVVLSTYDDMDRVATVTHPNGEVVTYRYGDHGLPIALESSVKGAIVRSVTYNALGKPFDLALGNGLTTSYRYWGTDYTVYGSRHYGLPYTITTLSASLQSLTYDYDWVGNVKSLTDGRNNETINFTYDDLDRLTLASCPSYGEVYAYDAIGNMTSKGGVTHNFPVPADHQPRPHAPTWVDTSSNPYGYDNNGNLISAEGRTYEYNVENRLTRVLEGGSPLRTFTYDADGALRWVDQSGQKTHYVTPDYQVNVATGEVSVYYRFSGRAVAWRNNSGLRYMLADHLSSSHAEVGESQAEMGQRRFYPFGSDRAVPGANDISDEERFTSQRRSDAGGGNGRRELYHYGARWYLPGVGIFTQPDTVVPDYKNPQALNRFAYVLNNPARYTDPTGHAWEDDFEKAHGRPPTQQDREDYEFSLANPGSGASGIWTNADWAAYGAARNYGWQPAFGLGHTRGSLRQRLRINSALFLLSGSKVGSSWANLLQLSGTTLGFGGDLSSRANATVTWGNEIQIEPGWESTSVEGLAALLAHEAVHVERQATDPRAWPWTGEAEEDRAYLVQYQTWIDVKGDKTDSDWLTVEMQNHKNFKEYIKRSPAYYWSVGPFKGRLPWVGE